MIFIVETAWEISTCKIICFHIRPMFGILSVLASSTQFLSLSPALLAILSLVSLLSLLFLL